MKSEEPDPFRVGVIGWGSMGSMLLRGFLASGSLEASSCLVSTRSAEKRAAMQASLPGVRVSAANRDTAGQADLLFVCVKPLDMRAVLDEIKDSLKPGCHVVSIAACVSFANLRKVLAQPVTRLIPSLTSEVREGVSLVCHDERVSPLQKGRFDRLVTSISSIMEIAEERFELGSDLTSCAPGLIATIFNEFVEAALPHGGFTREEATALVQSTLYGTATLMHSQGLGFAETLARVATKGGITELGSQVLQAGLPAVFGEMYRATLARHVDRKRAVDESFA